MHTYKHIALALVLLCTFVACSKNSTEPEAPSSAVRGNFEASLGTGMLPTQLTQNISGVLATMEIAINSTGNDDSKLRTGAAWFFGQETNPGTIKVNNITCQYVGNQSNGRMYQTVAATGQEIYKALPFNGATHTWTVSGGGSLPSFTAQQTTPTHVEITSHAPFDKVSQSQPLTITWNDPAAERPDELYALVINDAQKKSILVPNVGRAGTHTFSAQELSQFQRGGISLQVLKNRYSTVEKGDYRYVVIAQASRQITMLML